MSSFCVLHCDVPLLFFFLLHGPCVSLAFLVVVLLFLPARPSGVWTHRGAPALAKGRKWLADYHMRASAMSVTGSAIAAGTPSLTTETTTSPSSSLLLYDLRKEYFQQVSSVTESMYAQAEREKDRQMQRERANERERSATWREE